MKLFQTLVWAALAVALLVGSVQTVVHEVWAVPIILEAETYEDQKVAPSVAAHSTSAATDAHEHEHVESEWVPQDGVERTFWTWVANVLHGFSMAVLALAFLSLYAWKRGAAVPRWVLLAGVAVVGFVSVHLWPALGLPPEIPGMDAARLGSRQGWWVLASGCAVLSCGTALFGRTPWRWGAAVVWLTIPFFVGAPHIASDPLSGFSADAQAVLRSLGEQFVWVTYGIAISFWLCLAIACTWVFERWVRRLLPSESSMATPTGGNLRVPGHGS